MKNTKFLGRLECSGRFIVERYSFDPTKCDAPLRRLHKGAHWLSLVSRRPL